VAASGRFALWSHLAGQVAASPGGARDGGGRATGSASVHGTRGSSISGLFLRRSATIGDVLDSVLACAGDAFYAAAEVADQHHAGRHPGRPAAQDSHVMCPADAVTSTGTGTVAVSATTTSITCTFSDQAGVGLPVSSRG